MNITIIGTGYVGLVTGACLADMNLKVTCVDNNESKIVMLNQCEMPIYEDGLKEIVTKNLQNGNLKFSSNLADSLSNADIVFLAVGTPPIENSSKVDMNYIYQAANEIKQSLTKALTIVVKSTVPVGTNAELVKIFAGTDCEIISNPEFLREGMAIYDFKNPERIVIGASSQKSYELMAKLYHNFSQIPFVNTSPQSAELIKYAANGFLATKIAFINEMADLCEKLGADIASVAYGLGLDSRIGNKFLQPGPGFGGSCFPKDSLALYDLALQHNFNSTIIETVINSNELRIKNLANRIIDLVSTSNDKKICCLGLAFKAGTDDVRESPAIRIIQLLLKAGFKINAYDPIAINNAIIMLPDQINYYNDPYVAAKDCHAIVVLTEWPEFAQLDFAIIKSKMEGKIMIDYRNLFATNHVVKSLFDYHSLGF